MLFINKKGALRCCFYRNRDKNRGNINPDRTIRRPDYDLDYTRRNVFGQPTVRQSGIDAIFDPIDPATPEFFDYDPKKNYGPDINL